MRTTIELDFIHDAPPSVRPELVEGPVHRELAEWPEPFGEVQDRPVEGSARTVGIVVMEGTRRG